MYWGTASELLWKRTAHNDSDLQSKWIGTCTTVHWCSYIGKFQNQADMLALNTMPHFVDYLEAMAINVFSRSKVQNTLSLMSIFCVSMPNSAPVLFVIQNIGTCL